MFLQVAENGRIDGAIFVERRFSQNYQGHLWFEDSSIDLKTHYILNGEITERPDSLVTRTDLTLHDVPDGSKLHINEASYDAEGTVELEFPLPGTFKLRVECFPFLDFVDEVTV